MLGHATVDARAKNDSTDAKIENIEPTLDKIIILV